MMTNPNEELQSWMADWQQTGTGRPAGDALQRYVRRRSRLLVTSLVIEALVAVIGATGLTYLWWTRVDPLERAVMATVAVACIGLLVFGWWNWRGSFKAAGETTAVYLELSASRLARFRRALYAGWTLLAVEAVAFTIWVWYRTNVVSGPGANRAAWPWLLLIGMCGGAAVWLTVLGRWARREAIVIEHLRREYHEQ
jgi:hypothetical protein